MPFAALKVIRPVVNAASSLAPRLVGNLAFKAFCIPPKPRRLTETQAQLTDRALRRLQDGETLRLAYHGTTFPGGDIAAWRFASVTKPARGVVALVHGWTSRAAFMSAFVEPLTEAGFDVVLLDLPGHGASPGRTLHVSNGIAALHALHRATGPWAGLVGHSFGGALAVAFASGAVAGFPPVAVGRLALISAPHSMPAIFRMFGSAIGLSPRGQEYLDANVLRLSGRDLASFECDRLLASVGVPTVVVHAPDDREVPVESAQAYAAAGPHVTLKLLPGLGHRRILYSPAAAREVTGFVAAA